MGTPTNRPPKPRPSGTAHPALQLEAAGFTDLVSVIPPNGELTPNSRINEDQRGKVPGRKHPSGWAGYNWRGQDVSPKEIAETGAGIGLRADFFPGLDIDVDAPKLATGIEGFFRELFGELPTRWSRDPRRLLVFRTNEPFGRLALRIQYDGEWHLVEWLSQGRQFVVHGRHPSGVDYRWDGRELWEFDPDELPLIDATGAQTVLNQLAQTLQGGGLEVRQVGNGNAVGDAPPQDSLRAPSIERLRDVVGMIPNSDEAFPSRGDFIEMGYAVKAAGGSEEDAALQIFMDWADRWDGGHNDPDYVEAQWESFKPPFRIGWPWLQGQAEKLSDYNSAVDTFPVVPDAESSAPSKRIAMLEEVNQTYAIAQIGSDVVILQERDGDVHFLKQTDFKLKLKNQTVPNASGSRSNSLANEWLKWSGRRQYERVVFKPGDEDVPPTEFNLWRGWAVDPDPTGSCDLYLWHIREVVCGGERDQYEWLMDWLAHLFQQPQKKPGTVVGLQGPQGAGKSIIGAVLKKLLGPSHVTADKPDHITGRFNSHLQRCLLLQAEEAFWGGNKKVGGALKHLVTGEYLQIERKGIDTEERPNYTRLLITTNEDHVWSTAIDDRRLAIFKVSDGKVGDLDYFDRMFEQLEHGGYETLLYELLNRSIDDDRLRRPPRTDALEAQAAESMSLEERWLLKVLQTGELPGKPGPGGTVRTTVVQLHADYLNEATRRERRYAKNPQAFGFFVQDHLLGEKTGERKRVQTPSGEVQSRVYSIPPLKEVRRKYSKRGRAATADWDGPNAWVAHGTFNRLEVSGEPTDAMSGPQSSLDRVSTSPRNPPVGADGKADMGDDT